MEITLEQLMSGKGTKIRDKQYLRTEQYVTPFLEKMHNITSDFRVKVELPSQITTGFDGNVNTDDITYNRVWVQAVLPPEYCFDNHDEVIGMVYGLDVRKPIAKLYKGALNRACTNLCIFQPDALEVQFMEPEKQLSFKPLDKLIDMQTQWKEMLAMMHNTEWKALPDNLETNLGRWIRNSFTAEYDNGYGKIKIGADTVVKAYKSMFIQQDSPYYIGEGANVDLFTVYNSFTQLITNDRDKDLMNKCEKTILLRQILGF